MQRGSMRSKRYIVAHKHTYTRPYGSWLPQPRVIQWGLWWEPLLFTRSFGVLPVPADQINVLYMIQHIPCFFLTSCVRSVIDMTHGEQRF